jgi:DUF1680 family protein
VYATDYDTFTCDTATGIETPARFAETIYGRDADGIYVNLFIPSQVRSHGLVLRQATGFPDDPVTRLSVVEGTATITLRVRVPGWAAGPPGVRLNGTPVSPVQPPGPGWVAIRRRWQAGDLLEVTLPMTLTAEPTPDHPAVQALTYGPVVLSAVYPANPGPVTPRLKPAEVGRTAAQPMTFGAVANGKPIRMIPVSRAAHECYTVYFQTV